MSKCVKNREELKQLEDKEEDCFILDFNPNDDFDSLSDTTSLDSEIHLLAHKGQIACRDYPHPRHACAIFPFNKTPHETHCELCYCYVCDFAAPCKKWLEGHCDAFNHERWSIKRKLKREAVERKKEAYKVYPHPRYMCAIFPYEKTPHYKHCALCYCYVCEINAPCKKWVGTSNHCHAINSEKWRTERELNDQRRGFRSKQKLLVSGVPTATTEQEESNRVRQHPQQDQPTHQTSSAGSSIEEENNEISDETKVRVGNLPRTVNSHDLAQLFCRAGVVKKSEIMYDDPVPGGCRTSRGFGFVTMGTIEEAVKVVHLFNGSYLENNAITVDRIKLGPHEKTYSIYVGNLSHKVDNERLEDIFNEHGYNIVSAQVIMNRYTERDRYTERSRGFGFVKMTSIWEREDAITALDGMVVDGRALRLAIAAPPYVPYVYVQRRVCGWSNWTRD